MSATLTLEQAKALMKSYVDRNEQYAELWEEVKYVRTLDRLVLILQMHVAGGLETSSRASFFLDEINLVPLYKKLTVGSTVYFQKLGYRPGWQFGKIVGTVTKKPCSDECLMATREVCRCSCGGHNHGKGHTG